MSEAAPKKVIWAWALYDLANTIYSALFVTVLFSPFITKILGGTEQMVGFTVSVATLSAMVAVPIVGAVSDQVGRRMPFIIVLTLGCCGAAALVSVANLYLAIGLAIVANFCYATSLAVYDALLPKLAPKGQEGSISGFGVSIGYIGQPFAFGIMMLVQKFAPLDEEMKLRVMFPVTAALFLLVALVPFRVIKESATPSGRSKMEEVTASLRSLKKTFQGLHKIPGFILFLLGTFFTSNAIFVVIVFITQIGLDRYSISIKEQMPILMGLSLSSAAGAFVFGKLTDLIMPKRVMIISCAMWMVAVGCMLLSTERWAFVAAGIIGGAAMGAFWASVRPGLMQFAESTKMGEYFGFLGMMNKASAAFGPFFIGTLITQYGYTIGLMGELCMFFIGFLLFLCIPLQSGQVQESTA